MVTVGLTRDGPSLFFSRKDFELIWEDFHLAACVDVFAFENYVFFKDVQFFSLLGRGV